MAGFTDVYDALWGLVDALGGPKKVGPRLRPGFSGADQWLRNCLNREHAQNLRPDQVVQLKQWGCEAGYHDAKHWIDRTEGYAPANPMTLESRVSAFLKQAEADRRRADESSRALRDLLTGNPELLALLKQDAA